MKVFLCYIRNMIRALEGFHVNQCSVWPVVVVIKIKFKKFGYYVYFRYFFIIMMREKYVLIAINNLAITS